MVMNSQMSQVRRLRIWHRGAKSGPLTSGGDPHRDRHRANGGGFRQNLMLRVAAKDLKPEEQMPVDLNL